MPLEQRPPRIESLGNPPPEVLRGHGDDARCRRYIKTAEFGAEIATGISKRQAKYQRRMSSLLACRQFESPGK
jgi:hypothetical protein